MTDETKDVKVTLTVVVTPEFASWVDALARAQGATRAGYIRWLLERELAKSKLGSDTKPGHR